MSHAWSDGHPGESKKLRVWRIFRPEMGRYVYLLTPGQLMVAWGGGCGLSVHLLSVPGVARNVTDGEMRRAFLSYQMCDSGRLGKS